MTDEELKDAIKRLWEADVIVDRGVLYISPNISTDILERKGKKINIVDIDTVGMEQAYIEYPGKPD